MWRIHKNKILFLASQLQHTNKESSLFPLADGNYYERGLLVFHFRSNHLTLALQKETNLKVSDKNLSLKTKLICPSWKTSTCLYYHWKFSFGSFLKIKKQKPDWRQCLNWKAEPLFWPNLKQDWQFYFDFVSVLTFCRRITMDTAVTAAAVTATDSATEPRQLKPRLKFDFEAQENRNRTNQKSLKTRFKLSNQLEPKP